jgi:hypothetical protein
MQTCVARIAIIGLTASGEKRNARAVEPPGDTRFSTFFYVAAIGGK